MATRANCLTACVLAACLCSSPAQAALRKTFNFESLPLSEHSQGQLFVSAVQDDQGFMWFATSDGLVKFDGYRFSAFRHDPDNPNSSLSDNVYSVFIDRDGVLWVGSQDGLSRFDRTTEAFHKYPSNRAGFLESDLLIAIVEDAEGNLWLGNFFYGHNRTALRRFDKANGSYTNYRHDPNDPTSLPPGAIATLYVDREGVLWVSTYAYEGVSDLAWFDRERGVFQRFFTCDPRQSECPQPESPSDRPGDTQVGGVFEDGEGRIWINGDGLTRYDRQSNTYVRYSNSRPLEPSSNHNRVNGNIVQDRTGMLWYDHRDRGLTRFDPEADRLALGPRIDADQVVAPDMVLENYLRLYEDHGGTIWICDNTKQVRRFDPAALKFGQIALPADNGGSGNNFSSVSAVEDPTGAIWLGDINFGLRRLDRATGALESFLPDPGNSFSLNNGGIRALEVDSSGRLWIGTNLGISYYEAETGRFHYVPVDPRPSGHGDARIHTIAEDAKGNLWLGSDNAIYRLNPSTNDVLPYRSEDDNSNGLRGQWFHVFALDDDPSIWIGSISAVSRLDPETGIFTHYPHDDRNPDSIGPGQVTSIIRDSVGDYWAASASGLFRIDPTTGVFSRAGNSGSPAPQSATDLLNDRLGNLWVATGRDGLWKYAPATGDWSHYDVRDGLADNVTINLAQSARDELLVGSNGGLNVFDPAQLPDSRLPPRVSFTNFLLRNTPVPVSREDRKTPLARSISVVSDITLRHSDYLFSFEFAAPGYRYPESVRYAYRLVGFDSDWLETGADERHATYTNVPPGDYTLRVRAAGRDDTWSPHEAVLHLTIRPPWWRTWWAYSAYVLAFLLVLASYIRLRTLALTGRTRLLEKTVAERTAQILEHERQIEHQAEELQHALDLKEKLITNISHEFRTPLTLILGPVRRLLDRSPGAEETQHLQTIRRSGLRLLRLVDQLLGLARLGNSENHSPRKPQPLGPTARAIVESFLPLAAQKGLGLELNTVGQPWIAAESDALEVILLNLLSNAIKYTPLGGTVRVEVGESASGEVELTVADTGIGIPQEEQDAVFERFHRAGDHREHTPGAGIGLALVSDVVAAHGGSIELASRPAEGTVIIVRLPSCDLPQQEIALADDTLLSSAVEDELELLSYRPPPTRTDEPEDDDNRPSVLIVEDNQDLQGYLVELLSPDYRCDLAGDGEVALERAREHIPDLVLLDVMLPKLDGFEVSRALKEDERTSHIPIIMLTARQDRESRLGGWREKIDAYLTKPFDDEELKLRIANLLEIRDILRQRFRNHFFEEPAPAQVLNDKESRFVERLEQALEKNHGDPEFGVTELASEVFMSTRQLQRKMKSVVGHSPTEYLRSFRLRRSRELLRSGMQVGLVADAVGFSSPAYFSSCFKAQFGQTPSECQEHFGFHVRGT